jgi:hypothetical protein
MPTKRSSKGSPPEPTATYAEWKAYAAAMLSRKEWR